MNDPVALRLPVVRDRTSKHRQQRQNPHAPDGESPEFSTSGGEAWLYPALLHKTLDSPDDRPWYIALSHEAERGLAVSRLQNRSGIGFLHGNASNLITLAVENMEVGVIVRIGQIARYVYPGTFGTGFRACLPSSSIKASGLLRT